MKWIIKGKIPAPILIRMIQEDAITGDVRIVWTVDNTIFLATKDTFIDMIEDTAKPSDIFDIWVRNQEKET